MIILPQDHGRFEPECSGFRLHLTAEQPPPTCDLHLASYTHSSFAPFVSPFGWQIELGFFICLLRACCYGTGQPLNFGLLLHGSSSCSTRPRPVLTQDWENVDNKAIRQHWLTPGEKINILRSFHLQFLSDPRLNVVPRTTESPNDLQRLSTSPKGFLVSGTSSDMLGSGDPR